MNVFFDRWKSVVSIKKENTIGGIFFYEEFLPFCSVPRR
jgi:hypothetical protein